MLKLTAQHQGDLLSLGMEGELALESVEEFLAAVSQYTPQVQRLQLDCRGLVFVDSTGMNALLQVVLRWRRAQVQIQVVNLADDLHDMLDILGFFDVLAQEP